MFIVINVKYMI